jgi:hypothetical protein
MEGLDYWRLCDSLSVVQAALLILNEDPSGPQFSVENRSASSQPEGYTAVSTALKHAISSGKLPATIASFENGNQEQEISWHATVVAVEDLRVWLKSRGVKSGFFFPGAPDGPDYLNEFHDNYSQKLAAAIAAWEAVTSDPELRKGRTVKQALDKWLRQHANEFGLTKDDGNPNEQGIEEIAKIANWDTKGGAPKTPGP